MDTKDIEYFEVVYNERSINKAAQKLFITPQGLGRIIRKLESEVGQSLFERTAHGIIPTENGIIFHRRSAEISRKLHALQKEMDSAGNNEKHLKIGFANGILRALPLDLINSFKKKHPEIDVEWVEYSNEAVKDKLNNSEIDYGFTIGVSANSNFTQKLIRSIPIVILSFAGHHYYDLPKISLDMLKDEPVIIMNEHFQMYHDFIKACRLQGFFPNIAVRTADAGTLIGLCVQGAGLGISPDFSDKKLIHSVLSFPPEIHVLQIEGSPMWDIYCAYNSDYARDDITLTFDRHVKSYPLK